MAQEVEILAHKRQGPLYLAKMAIIFADDIYKCIFMNEVFILNVISLFVPRSPID